MQNFINQTKNPNGAPLEWSFPAAGLDNAKKVAASSEKPSVVQNVNPTPLLIDNSSVKDEFIKYKKKRNKVEKLTDGVRNLTHIGYGSKKTEKAIQNSNNEEAKAAFNKYKASNETASQTIGDSLAAVSGLGAFYGIAKGAKYLDSLVKLDMIPESYIKAGKKLLEETPKIKPYKTTIENAISGAKNFISSKPKVYAAGAIAAMLAGGIVKNVLLKPKRKKYKLDKEQKALPRKEKKEIKKQLRKENRKENRRNFLTGAVNGAGAPLLSLLGVAGVPIYAVGSFALRNKTAKNKSGSIAEDFKNNAFITTAGAIGLSALMIKKGRGYKVFEANMDKFVEKFKGVKLINPDFDVTRTSYSELEKILLGDEKIQKILHQYDTDKVIKELTEENIFAVKFKQIQGGYDPIAEALRENCPPSRTLDEAQKVIDGLSSNGEYKVKKLLGAGTIAETYEAVDSTGKDVCIKILKNGISKSKIEADKAKFVKLITDGNFSKEEKDYFIRNIDNLAEGILQEVDFKNEMEAAKKLAKYTKKASVVVPIKADDGIYVMEKAKGISVRTLSNYCMCMSEKEYYTDLLSKAKSGITTGRTVEEITKELANIEKQLAQIKKTSPDFKDFELSNKEVKRFLTSYINAYTEQFEQINADGKIIHADIHPGNIFIDIEGLKSGKKNILTLIDTGNTINLSAAQSKRALELAKYIRNGNVSNITSYVLEGAHLPEGMTKDTAYKLVEGEFKKLFFDNKTELRRVTNDSVLSTANGIMKKHGIVPSDDQLNLIKAKQSASNSFEKLKDSFFVKKHGAAVRAAEDEVCEIDDIRHLNKGDKKKIFNYLGVNVKYGADSVLISIKETMASKIQQAKNIIRSLNTKSLKEVSKNGRLNKNSEEYLTYKTKPFITNFQKMVGNYEDAVEAASKVTE